MKLNIGSIDISILNINPKLTIAHIDITILNDITSEVDNLMKATIEAEKETNDKREDEEV
jgi:hypothetical protein